MAPRLDRRTFLTAAGVGTAGAVAALRPWEALLDAAGRDPLAPGTGVLVLVTLYGGNDGLNTVIPYDDRRYQDARPELAYQAGQVLRIDGGLGLNPSLKRVKKLWDDGHLAVVQGVGYPNPNRSHFRSMDIWQTGSPESPSHSGWLGRWLDATGTDPLRAVGVGATLPILLAGEKTAGAAVPLGPLAVPAGPQGQAFRAVEDPFPGQPRLAARVAQSGEDLLAVAARLQPVLGQVEEGEQNGPVLEGSGGKGGAELAPMPGLATGHGPERAKRAGRQGELADQLGIVARLVKAGVPTRVYNVSLGGFDTHADEKGTQERLLAELDAGIGSFFDALGDDPRGKGVVLATFSEFGRRVAANGSQGTDHGTAAPMLVAGRSVRGGLHGEPPDLVDLDDGDLKHTTDFRRVFATLLERVLDADPETALGRGRFDALEFL
jgi:uncharacterized protein (DUF1501 family)